MTTIHNLPLRRAASEPTGDTAQVIDMAKHASRMRVAAVAAEFAAAMQRQIGETDAQTKRLAILRLHRETAVLREHTRLLSCAYEDLRPAVRQLEHVTTILRDALQDAKGDRK